MTARVRLPVLAPGISKRSLQHGPSLAQSVTRNLPGHPRCAAAHACCSVSTRGSVSGQHSGHSSDGPFPDRDLPLRVRQVCKGPGIGRPATDREKPCSTGASSATRTASNSMSGMRFELPGHVREHLKDMNEAAPAFAGDRQPAVCFTRWSSCCSRCSTKVYRYHSGCSILEPMVADCHSSLIQRRLQCARARHEECSNQIAPAQTQTRFRHKVSAWSPMTGLGELPSMRALIALE